MIMNGIRCTANRLTHTNKLDRLYGAKAHNPKCCPNSFNNLLRIWFYAFSDIIRIVWAGKKVSTIFLSICLCVYFIIISITNHHQVTIVFFVLNIFCIYLFDLGFRLHSFVKYNICNVLLDVHVYVAGVCEVYCFVCRVWEWNCVSWVWVSVKESFFSMSSMPT